MDVGVWVVVADGVSVKVVVDVTVGVSVFNKAIALAVLVASAPASPPLLPLPNINTTATPRIAKIPTPPTISAARLLRWALMLGIYAPVPPDV